MKPQQLKKNKKASCRPTPSNWHAMNRKQRREMTRKIQSEDLSLEVVHPDAAGIDIGNESHYVAVPPTRDSQPVRRFGCTTWELKEMAVWLKQCAIRTIALPSTGVYWIAVYDILEQAGFEVYLVNANQTKNLPGRKSDVQESQWLMKLHTYGLLRNSFRPSQEIRTMRTYWRQRNDLVRAAGRHIQRMQKAVTTTMTILSEPGWDMSKWKTEHHFVSWLRLCPDNRISGDKIIGKGRLPTNNRVTNALRMAASTLRLSNTYLGAQFRRLRTKLGAPVAIKAMAAKLARLVYRMLRYGMQFVDQGANVTGRWSEQARPQQTGRREDNLRATLAHVGCQAQPNFWTLTGRAGGTEEGLRSSCRSERRSGDRGANRLTDAPL
jgi:transposase